MEEELRSGYSSQKESRTAKTARNSQLRSNSTSHLAPQIEQLSSRTFADFFGANPTFRLSTDYKMSAQDSLDNSENAPKEDLIQAEILTGGTRPNTAASSSSALSEFSLTSSIRIASERKFDHDCEMKDVVEDTEEAEPYESYRNRDDRVLLGEWVEEDSVTGSDRPAVYGYVNSSGRVRGLRVKETRTGEPLPYLEAIIQTSLKAPEISFESYLRELDLDMLGAFIIRRLKQLSEGEDPEQRSLRDSDEAKDILSSAQKPDSSQDADTESKEIKNSPSTPSRKKKACESPSTPVNFRSPKRPKLETSPATLGKENDANTNGIFIGVWKEKPEYPVFAFPKTDGRMEAFIKVNRKTPVDPASRGKKVNMEDIDFEAQFESLSLAEVKKMLRQSFFGTGTTPNGIPETPRHVQVLQSPRTPTSTYYTPRSSRDIFSPTRAEVCQDFTGLSIASFFSENKITINGIDFTRRLGGDLKGYYVAESLKSILFGDDKYFRKYKVAQKIDDEVIVAEGCAYVEQDSSLYEKKDGVVQAGESYFEILELLYPEEL